LQASADLAVNGWFSVPQAGVHNGTEVSVTVPASADRKFFRLKAL
jgi:hypothetical protein